MPPLEHPPYTERDKIDHWLFNGRSFSIRCTQNFFANKFQILIAGCGTGKHTLSTATKFTSAQVLGIDFSILSFTYASRKSNDLGVTNVNYAQADILKMD